MDFDSWVFTIAVIFCAIALAVYEPKPKKPCEIYHASKNVCTTFNDERVYRY